MSDFEFRHAVSNQGNRDILIFEIFKNVGFYFEQKSGQIYLMNGQPTDTLSVEYEGEIFTPSTWEMETAPMDIWHADPGKGALVLSPNTKGYFSVDGMEYSPVFDIAYKSSYVQMDDIEIRTSSHPNTIFAINGFNRYQGDHNVILWVGDIIKVIACEKP